VPGKADKPINVIISEKLSHVMLKRESTGDAFCNRDIGLHDIFCRLSPTLGHSHGRFRREIKIDVSILHSSDIYSFQRFPARFIAVKKFAQVIFGQRCDACAEILSNGNGVPHRTSRGRNCFPSLKPQSLPKCALNYNQVTQSYEITLSRHSIIYSIISIAARNVSAGVPLGRTLPN